MAALVLEALPWTLMYFGFPTELAGALSTVAGIAGSTVSGPNPFTPIKRQKTIMGSSMFVTGSSPGKRRRDESQWDTIMPDPKRRKIGSAPDAPVYGSAPYEKVPSGIPSSPNENMSDNIIPLVSDNVTITAVKKKLHGEPINHYRSQSFLCDGDEGEEKIIALGSLGTTSQWTVSTVGAQNDVTSPVPWLALDTFQGVPAGDYYTVRGHQKDQELVLDYVTQIWEFTNLANIPAFCHLNMYKVKEANGTDPILLGSVQYEGLRALPDPVFALPAAADIDGHYSAAGITATGESLPWAINHPPTKGFDNVFGKVKDWRFQLPAGGRLALKIGIKMGMVGSRSQLVLPLGVFPLRPEGSIVSTFSSFGAPVMSSVTANMTHGHTKVGIIITSMLKFRHVDVKVAADKRYTQFTGLAANNAIATETFLDTDLDEVSAVIEVP